MVGMSDLPARLACQASRWGKADLESLDVSHALMTQCRSSLLMLSDALHMCLSACCQESSNGDLRCHYRDMCSMGNSLAGLM